MSRLYEFSWIHDRNSNPNPMSILNYNYIFKGKFLIENLKGTAFKLTVAFFYKAN